MGVKNFILEKVQYCPFISWLWSLSVLCREKEEQRARVTEVQRLQAQQADAALEEFKRQVELNSEKVYAEMKEQVRPPWRPFSKSLSVGRVQSDLKYDGNVFT